MNDRVALSGTRMEEEFPAAFIVWIFAWRHADSRPNTSLRQVTLAAAPVGHSGARLLLLIP